MNLDKITYEFNELSEERRNKDFKAVMSYFEKNPDDLEAFFRRWLSLKRMISSELRG